ncbi:hypothetical protein KsCSTR_26870 [Candidatus Kuenenia stuttgartiensis]|uniref:Uncharacterized protein n=1 Tax=Kuenenia stuttgartiensis TaxID=174633 RepID=Q1Q7D1_KUEST|nr:hypothetical protein KsCSTR_26870 [Candidatus Kuenenia stuttgartiensis]CAJ73485.1 unknown protein [Candidatus Kuenenia stuttgartiensis]
MVFFLYREFFKKLKCYFFYTKAPNRQGGVSPPKPLTKREHPRFFVKMPLAGRERIVTQASSLRVKCHKQDACVTMYN